METDMNALRNTIAAGMAFGGFLAAAATLAVLAPALAHAEDTFRLTYSDATGWGADVLGGFVAPGDEATIIVTGDNGGCRYDILIVSEAGEPVELRDVDICGASARGATTTAAPTVA
jgi:hypothetical protein